MTRAYIFIIGSSVERYIALHKYAQMHFYVIMCIYI